MGLSPATATHNSKLEGTLAVSEGRATVPQVGVRIKKTDFTRNACIPEAGQRDLTSPSRPHYVTCGAAKLSVWDKQQGQMRQEFCLHLISSLDI